MPRVSPWYRRATKRPRNATTVTLPTLHAGQVGAFQVIQRRRFVAVRCGRRWGKTAMGVTLAADLAVKGYPVGWFAPDYKVSSESYRDLEDVLLPAMASSSKVEGRMATKTGGRVDFWTLDNDRAGRSRKYKLVLIDEAAFTKPNMREIWERSIKPTLLDLGGRAVVLSNANGVSEDNFLWQVCHLPELQFYQYHAPTHQNPHLPREEVAKLQRDNAPLVYQQEYLAEFINWAGAAFFPVDWLLYRGRPAPWPEVIDAVFAVVDTAMKTGQEHDGTAVVYFGLARVPFTGGYKLLILDWDYVQIEGAFLERWIPQVATTLEELMGTMRVRVGSLGVFAEDANAGTILIQKGLCRAIDSGLTAMGKDERAIAASGPLFRGEVKLTQRAYDRVTAFKGVTRNHLITQLTSFRVGDKDAAKRADDLLDGVTYGTVIALGNERGF